MTYKTIHKGLKKSSGKTSTILLVLGIAILILAVVVFVVLKINATRNANNAKVKTVSVSAPVTPPPPVYQVNLGNVSFTIISSQDMGNVLYASNSSDGYGQNLTTTEKFIKVTIGAQNTGKFNLNQGSWQMGNIVDSDGRNFISINDEAYNFLPNPNLCGTVLEPDFQPTPCVGYYEVSKESTGLKLQVEYSGQSSGKNTSAYLDLNVN